MSQSNVDLDPYVETLSQATKKNSINISIESIY